ESEKHGLLTGGTNRNGRMHRSRASRGTCARFNRNRARFDRTTGGTARAARSGGSGASRAGGGGACDGGRGGDRRAAGRRGARVAITRMGVELESPAARPT